MKLEATPEIYNRYGLTPVKGQVLWQGMHITDLHLAPLGRIPSSRTQTFHEDVAAEYGELAIAAKGLDVDAIMCSGDLFHLKATSVYYPETLTYHADVLESLGKPFISIPGNHDLPNSSYQEIFRSAYHAMVRQASNATDLATVKASDGSFCMGNTSVPFPINLSQGGHAMEVVVHGLPFYKREILLEELAKLNERLDPTKINVILLHGDFFPDAHPNPFVQPIPYSQLLSTVNRGNIFCLGHIHLSYDVHVTTENGTLQVISKPWSFGRVSRDYFQSTDVLELRHKPSFGFITLYLNEAGTLAVDVQYGVVPHRPFEEVFLRESLAQEIKESVAVSEYVQQLKKGATENMVDPDAFMVKHEGELPEKVKALINKHLLEASM